MCTRELVERHRATSLSSAALCVFKWTCYRYTSDPLARDCCPTSTERPPSKKALFQEWETSVRGSTVPTSST